MRNEARASGALLVLACISVWCPGLQAQALRDITAEDLLSIHDLTVSELDDFSGVPLSPDGRWLAVQIATSELRSNRTSIRYVVAAVDGSRAAEAVAEGGDLEPIQFGGVISEYGPPRGLLWTADSKSIIYRVRRNGETQLWKTSVEGREHEQLTANAGDVQAVVWSRDKKKVLYGTTNPRAVAKAKRDQEARRGFLYDERFIPLHERTPLVIGDVDGLVPQSERVWVYDLDAKRERPATTAEVQEYAELTIEPLLYPVAYNDSLNVRSQLPGHPRARWIRSATGSKLTVWLDDVRDKPDVGVRPPLAVVASRGTPGRSATVCRAPECTGYFKGLWPDPRRPLVHFLRWRGSRDFGAVSLYTWNLASGTVHEVIRTEDLLEACAQSGKVLLCAHESATSPRKLVALDVEDGSMRTVFDPNTNFKNLRFGEVSALYWRDQNGVEGFGHVVKPPDFSPTRRYPLVIVQYRSRGFLRGGVGDEYPIHVLAAQGFVVLSFHRPDDWELEASSRDYAEVDKKRWAGLRDRRRVLSVLEAGIDKLAEGGLVDANHVALTGLSDGSETLEFALVHSPQRFAAAIASGTFWNPVIFHLIGPTWQKILQQRGLGDPADPNAYAEWRAVSIGASAIVVRTPLLVQVSEAEMLPATQTISALTLLHKPVEMHVFPGEYHVKAQPAHRYNAYRRSVQWLQFWLQGVEVAEPVDPQQYERWRRLRDLNAAQQVTSLRE